ncbi:hypothetical protein GGI11_004572 [Coemansia sp. RSA 2049]|nr:hypothetical protein LPJ72_002023 [Coemansia sp. Benny D160-2]KAJ2512955.1 hypothetical protein GGI11_004572 [Coemansia sp. RSA 2049]
MPICQITTNVQLSDDKALSFKVSETIAELLSRPLGHVMTMITYNSSLTFGGTGKPAVFVYLGSAGSVGGKKNKSIVAGITELLASELDIDPNRINIRIEEIDISQLGLGGKTFV